MAQLALRARIEADLAQWGLWARHRYLPGCYTEQPYYTKPMGFNEEGIPLDVLGNRLTIDDNYAMFVDRAVAQLERLDPIYPDIARLKFISQLSVREISDIVNARFKIKGQNRTTNKDKVGSIVGEIISWVACCWSLNSSTGAT